MVKAVIFSAAHIILNSDKAWAFFCKKFNIKKEDLLELRKKFIDPAKEGKLSKNELINSLAIELKKDKSEIKKVFDYGGKLLEKNNEVIKIMDDLKEKGYKIALITNTTELFASLSVEKEIYKKINPSILSYKVKILKPKIGIYEIALKKLNLNPNDCIYIDTKEEHLIPAKKLGMKTILFENNTQLKKELIRL